MKQLLVALFAILASSVAAADSLKKTDAEYIQLVAMGFDVEDSIEGHSLATRGDHKIILSKDPKKSLLSISRLFTVTKQKLTPSEELKYLQAVNKANEEFAFQITLMKEIIICALYQYGPHDTKAFANLVSEIEKCNYIYDKQPVLLELSP